MSGKSWSTGAATSCRSTASRQLPCLVTPASRSMRARVTHVRSLAVHGVGKADWTAKSGMTIIESRSGRLARADVSKLPHLRSRLCKCRIGKQQDDIAEGDYERHKHKRDVRLLFELCLASRTNTAHISVGILFREKRRRDKLD